MKHEEMKMLITIGRIHGIAFSLSEFKPKDNEDSKAFNQRCASCLTECAEILLEYISTKG